MTQFCALQITKDEAITTQLVWASSPSHNELKVAMTQHQTLLLASHISTVHCGHLF